MCVHLPELGKGRGPLMAKLGAITRHRQITSSWWCRYSSLMCSMRTTDNSGHDAGADKLQADTPEPQAATAQLSGRASATERVFWHSQNVQSIILCLCV